MESKKDLTGQKFFCWTVIKLSFRIGKKSYWECRCDCGTIRVVQEYDLKNKEGQTCGCLKNKGKPKKIKITHKINELHGMSSWPEHKVWRNMKGRCYNRNDQAFADYGGRGIEVCESWRNSFTNFITDMGRRPSSDYSIDRIDNDKNYEKGNCKWSTHSQQAGNRRKKRILTFDGKSLTLAQLARIAGIKYNKLLQRLNENWPSKPAAIVPKVYKIDNTMIGKRFNRLVVLEFSHRNSGGQKYWKTICDCGKIKVIRQNHLRGGSIKSCGCLYIERLKQRNETLLTSRFVNRPV